MIMSNVQEWKYIQRLLDIHDDGVPGCDTLKALCARLGMTKHVWDEVQRLVGSTADGVPGPNTAKAVLAYIGQGIKLPKIWPDQREVRSNKSIFGKPGNNLAAIDLAYPMRLSWDLNTTVLRMTVNVACAEEVKAIFKETLDYYGYEQIKRLGLDLFGGCYNNREVRGGSALSMHAYGCAIDLDPDENQLKWGRDKAKLATPECEAFWRIVESHGGVSLGRNKNYDWMHFQFARMSLDS